MHFVSLDDTNACYIVMELCSHFYIYTTRKRRSRVTFCRLTYKLRRQRKKTHIYTRRNKKENERDLKKKASFCVCQPRNDIMCKCIISLSSIVSYTDDIFLDDILTIFCSLVVTVFFFYLSYFVNPHAVSKKRTHTHKNSFLLY